MENIRESYFYLGNSTLILMLCVFAASLVITAVCTGTLIPILKKYKARQIIHEDVPENHKGKSGTPTMGGIAMVLGIVVACIVASMGYLGYLSTDTLVTLVALILFALLGFLDDYNKVVNKRNLGLTAKQKFFLQCLMGLLISINYVVLEDRATDVSIPFTDFSIDLGYWYILFMTFAIVAMVNSVNLTDGLDGLASGVSLIVALFFAIITVPYSMVSGNWFFVALAGACVGFLIYNHNPAKIFMGDTGSLAIGGGLAVAACYSDMELFLLIAGFVYVAEALSDIIQVASYKLRGGKRVFKMAPLHHHFELSGWSEKKIVAVFMLVTLILCIISFIAM